jgi:Ca-activated chloride channel homolog
MIFLSFGHFVYADNINKTNELKKQAEVAFKNKDYKKAESIYNELFSKYEVKDEFARLNYAHSQYLNGKTNEAISNYQSLTNATEKIVKSISNQQLGNIQAKNNDYKQALEFYKKALISDPNNEEARFNAELMKKKLSEENQNKDQKENQKENEKNKEDKKEDNKNDKNQENKDGKDDGKKNEKESEGEKEKENKEGDNKREKEGKEDKEKKEGSKDSEKEKENEKGKENEKKGNKPSEKKEGKQDEKGNAEGKALENMKISPEKAKMLLDAMKNAEKQYLQQLKKEPTEKKNKSKPDW